MTLPVHLHAPIRELGLDPETLDLATIQSEIRKRCEAQIARRLHFDRVTRAYPLTASVLWRAPQSPHDQRRSVLAAMRAPVVTLVKGGERSGKSQGLKELTLAMALGGDHPVVRAWGAVNDLPIHTIPPGPAEVYATALTSADSRKYHRPDFANLVGDLPHVWRNMTGDGESSLTITVPGYRKPAIIHFKSIDQGSRSFQGISLRWVWIDEEPEGHEGKAVYVQCRARVMDQDGRIAISMVPRLGYTWVYEDLERDRKDNAVIIELNSLDNPHLPKERAQSHYASMTEDERAIHQYGRFRSRAGAIYPHWQAGDGDRWGMGHTCEPFEIPRDWTRFRAADFGLDNPTCVLWGALGDDDTLYIYREYYRGNGLSYPWHAARVARIEQGWQLIEDEKEEGREEWIDPPENYERETIECGWGDPASAEGRDAFNAADVAMSPANHDLATGYSSVRDRLRIRGDGRPRLKVFTTCRHTIREMGGLLKDPKRIDVIQIKRDDHAPDTLRYMSVGVDAWLGL